jgi:hypothetical protein
MVGLFSSSIWLANRREYPYPAHPPSEARVQSAGCALQQSGCVERRAERRHALRKLDPILQRRVGRVAT